MDRVDAFWHEDVLRHDTGAGVFDAEPQDWLEVPETHAENAERVRNMRGILRAGPLADRVRWHDGRHATVEELTTLHDADYVARGARRRAPRGHDVHAARRWSRRAPGRRSARPPGTAPERRRRRARRRRSALAYALVRPPGHHASQRTADGYCFVNNTALAAERARRSGARARRDRRLGRAPRQRHADDLLRARRRADRSRFHMRHRSWSAESHPRDGRAGRAGPRRRRGPQRQRRAPARARATAAT